MNVAELSLRIVVAAILGGVIGLERDRRGRPAGLRTHMIVALASATFMVVSTRFIEYQHYREHVDVDVSRIASAIVTGIGFLGGGAIMRTGLNVTGLTTAAGLWLVGAIGMAAGGAMYGIAVVATGLGLAVLSLLRRFEDKDDAVELQHVRVTLREAPLDEVLECLRAVGARASVVQAERRPGEGVLSALVEARAARGTAPQALLDALAACRGIESVRVERVE